MSSSRRHLLGLLSLFLSLGATAAMARTSRDGGVVPRGKPGQDIFLAITHGEHPGVHSLLVRGADPNARNCLGMIPLTLADGSGQMPVVETLLHAEAKVGASTLCGTALTFAAMGESAPVIKLLLDRGANVNPSRPDGTTVLRLAARNGDLEIVQDLLRRKADVNADDLGGTTALVSAASDGHLQVARLLLCGGLPITDLVCQRGVQFLLRTQEEDGSWFVTKRVAPGDHSFDEACPHGESRYASFNACGATIALLQTVDSAPPAAQQAAREASAK